MRSSNFATIYCILSDATVPTYRRRHIRTTRRRHGFNNTHAEQRFSCATTRIRGPAYWKTTARRGGVLGAGTRRVQNATDLHRHAHHRMLQRSDGHRDHANIISLTTLFGIRGRAKTTAPEQRTFPLLTFLFFCFCFEEAGSSPTSSSWSYSAIHYRPRGTPWAYRSR